MKEIILSLAVALVLIGAVGAYLIGRQHGRKSAKRGIVEVYLKLEGPRGVLTTNTPVTLEQAERLRQAWVQREASP